MTASLKDNESAASARRDALDAHLDVPSIDDLEDAGGGQPWLTWRWSIRLAVHVRDHFSCLKCGWTPLPVGPHYNGRQAPYGPASANGGRTMLLELDHVIPESAGGAFSEDNLQSLCTDCNREKADAAFDYRQPASASAARHTPSTLGDLTALDAQLDRLFGPSDPATDAWIVADDAVRRRDLAELERLSARLQMGVADYERRVRELERDAGIGVRR